VIVDFSEERMDSFQIYNMKETLRGSTNIFTRNSTFSYSMKNSKKVYKNKNAEFKVEKFAYQNSTSDEGKRVGYF
jgi:hypothetical protein